MPVPLLSSDHRYQLTREVWKDASNQEIREFVYAYDTVGNLLTAADNTINPSNGARTTASDALQFVYDSRDQLQLERAVNPLVAVSTVLDHDYDLNGRATALATNLGGTISGSNITGGVKDLTNQYVWDALGRLTSVTQTSQYGGNSVAAKLATYQYDAASQLTDLRRYSSTSAYSMYLEVHSRLGYDGAGRLQSLTHAKSEIASGQMWNGTSTLPTSLQGGKLLAGYFLAYDQDNRLTGWSSYADAFKTTFVYDTRDQVTTATHTAIAGLTLPRAMPASENYAFDGTGNRNLSGGSSSSANGTFNRVQNDGTYTYDFDAEGNQIRRTKISDGKVTEYEYDYRNRLVKVTEKNSLAGAATKVVTYQYDAFDRRTGKQLDSDANGTVDRKAAWVWDGQQVVMQFADADGAGAGAWKLTNRYLYGDAVDLVLADEQLPSGGIGLTSVSYTTGNVLWPLFDQLGSVRDVVDSNGVIRQHLVFDSFGNRLSETDYNTSGVVIPNNDPAAVDELFGYTGREWDSDVKLQYNRARWYDPAQGRWLSQDPIGFSAGDVNLYRYVGNGVTASVDPTGRDDDDPIIRRLKEKAKRELEEELKRKEHRSRARGSTEGTHQIGQATKRAAGERALDLKDWAAERNHRVVSDAIKGVEDAVEHCQGKMKQSQKKALNAGADAGEHLAEAKRYEDAIEQLKSIRLQVEAGEIIDVHNIDELGELALDAITKQGGWKVVLKGGGKKVLGAIPFVGVAVGVATYPEKVHAKGFFCGTVQAGLEETPVVEWVMLVVPDDYIPSSKNVEHSLTHPVETYNDASNAWHAYGTLRDAGIVKPPEGNWWTDLMDSFEFILGGWGR